MSRLTARIEDLRHFLASSRNPDGGWPYHPGKASRLEPTCWALLVLGQGQPASRVLETWPSAEGLLVDRATGSSNYAYHAVALLATRALRLEHAVGNAALVRALQRARGEALPPSSINRQDNSIHGWSWIAETFSWVEPTAWALLALKQWARMPSVAVDRTRIQDGERLLVDRSMRTGGWNYGNSNMLGLELKAFVPTTAVALLAMQDRRDLPEVARSVDFLEQHGTDERAGVSLALALMALSAFGRPAAAARDALIDQIPTTLDFGNQMAAALTLYALGEGGHDAVRL
jgi:hypothetical protein